ncbi:MAG: cation transporter [Eubacteriales bacterium]|nr:cation transporter [Eubacteriales bacterium]
MVKITANVEGMMCQHCEAHVNEAVRKAFPSVKDVTSSHSKNTTEIISEQELDEAAVSETIRATGYQVTGVKTEPYKKRFSLFGRK